MRTRITLAVLALLAVGCSENENASTPEIPVNAKAIRISQSVQGLTRALVTDGTNVTATVLMCDGDGGADWTGFKKEASNNISAGALNARANTGTASFKAGNGTTVKLNPTLYYDNVNSKNSYLVAVAPTGTLGTSGTLVTMNDVDGEQDVMYATAVDAGTSDVPTNPINLSFKHLTSQLNFEVKMTKAASNGDWTNKTVTVKEVKVQNVQLPKAVNAADGIVTWSSTSPLSVPDVNNSVLSTTATRTGSPVMVKGESFLKLDVTLTVDGDDLLFSNVPIKDALTPGSDLATETGKSHLVTLNVTEPEKATTPGVEIINVTATVAQWVVGNAGTGELK